MKKEKNEVRKTPRHVWKKRALTIALAALLLTSSGMQGFSANAAAGGESGMESGTIMDAESSQNVFGQTDENQKTTGIPKNGNTEAGNEPGGAAEGNTQGEQGNGAAAGGQGAWNGQQGEGGENNEPGENEENGGVTGENGGSGEDGAFGENGGSGESGTPGENGSSEEGGAFGENGSSDGSGSEGDGESGAQGNGENSTLGENSGSEGNGENGTPGENDGLDGNGENAAAGEEIPGEGEAAGTGENAALSGENLKEEEKSEEENMEEEDLTNGFVFVMVPMMYGRMRKAAGSGETVDFKAERKIPYEGWIANPDKPYSTNYFTVNGRTAYCVESHRLTPENNSAAVAEAYNNNKLLQKVLYYGHDCPEDIHFFDKYVKNDGNKANDNKYILTHIAASRAYLLTEAESPWFYNTMPFEGCSEEAKEAVLAFIKEIEDDAKYPAPGDEFPTLNPLENGVVKVDPVSGVQTSGIFSLEGDRNIYIDIDLGEDIQCYIKKANDGDVEQTRICGGEDFYFTAGKDVTGTREAGKVTYHNESIWRTLIISNTDKQDIGYAEFYEEEESELTLKVRWTKVVQLKLLKRDAADSQKTLSGAKFGVYESEADEDPIITLVTNEDGEASCYLDSVLEKVYVRELEAPENYVCNSVLREVSLKNDEECIITYTMTNKQNLKVSKRAIGETEELPGAEMELFQVAGGNEKLVEKWTSGKEAKTVSNLEPGTYKLIETEAPDGYRLSEAITFVLNEDGTVTQDGKVCSDYTVVMRDAKQKISFAKLSEESTDENPVYLKDAVLEVHRKLADGTMEDEVAQTIDGTLLQWTTTEDPKEFEGIKKGTYYLVETKAPHGYVKADPVEFEVTGAADEENPIAVKMIDCKTRVSIVKMFESADGKTYEISEKNPVKFEIYKAGEDTAKVKTIILTNKDPYVIEGLPVGSYILREISAPPGFTLAKDVPFEIKEGMDGEVAITTEVKVTNCATEFKVSKVDIANVKKLLPGAELEILNADTKELAVTAYGVALSWTSGSEPWTVKGLAAGKYILHEKKAPKGYDRAGDIAFEIHADGTITSKALDESGVLLMKDKKHEDETEETEETEETTGTEETGESEEESEKESETSERWEESEAGITGTDSIDQNGGHIGVQAGDDAPIAENALLFAGAAALIAVLFTIRGKRKKS